MSYARNESRRARRLRSLGPVSGVVTPTSPAPEAPASRLTRESYFCAVCGGSDNLIWCAIEEPNPHKVCAAHLSDDMLRCVRCVK